MTKKSLQLENRSFRILADASMGLICVFILMLGTNYVENQAEANNQPVFPEENKIVFNLEADGTMSPDPLNAGINENSFAVMFVREGISAKNLILNESRVISMGPRMLKKVCLPVGAPLPLEADPR